MFLLTNRLPITGRRWFALILLSLPFAMAGCQRQDPLQPTAPQTVDEEGRAAGSIHALEAAATPLTGLNFPSNGETGADIRFRWTGAALIPMYPATYVWRVNLRQQKGYYCNFYWGPASGFDAGAYYGAPPYPDGSGDKSLSLTHKWSLGSSGRDNVTDANGHSTQLGYDTWKTQSLRVYDNGVNKVHEFYWDLPDTTKVIRALFDRSYGSRPPASPALTVGDAPWSLRSERLSGILRGMQLYSAKLTTADLLAEIDAPMSTTAGSANVWYLNVNPTPSDIADKSGRGHHPAWVTGSRAALWTDASNPAPTVSLSANPTAVASGNASTLSWSSANATGCDATGAWSGTKALSGSQATGALTSTSTYTLTCTGAGGAASQSVTVTVSATPPIPTVSLSANPASVATGGSSSLSWSSTNATGCDASGAWSGAKALNGSQSTGALSANSTYTLTCNGAGGSASRSVTVSVTTQPPAPTVSLTANPATIASGSASTLTWSSSNATACNASGGWSGGKATSGSQSTGNLSSSQSYTLTCTGAGGSANQTATVTVSDPPPGGGQTGLDFPSNGQTSADIRFRFTGGNLQPMYPATYIWRVKLRQQSGYYTTFFWGPDGEFTGNGYYGAHPYPDGEPKDASRSHKWELSISGHDYVNDANGHSTQLGYDIWKTQSMRVWDNGSNKVHEFFWDLPDTTKVIRVVMDRSYGPNGNPAALTFGDAPWNLRSERLSGILRGIQTYSSKLTTGEINAEANAPMSTQTGSANVWYVNVNPTPSDISDKSGKGHNPAWVTSSKAALWTGP